MNPCRVSLPNDRIWLRVAKPDWPDPLDATFAQEHGGRWNPSKSFPALYLNADVMTARLQIERMLAGTPVTSDDLADDAYTLVAATLSHTQHGADAVSVSGLHALELPESYPLDASGTSISHASCQARGVGVHSQGLNGVWCRSACTEDGRGRELAWFPADHSDANPVWTTAVPFGDWRYANTWKELGFADQLDPE